QTYEITGLSASTDYIYFVRSQNSEGTAYSSVRTFTTSSGGSVVNEDTISVSVTSSENDIGYTLSSNSVSTTSIVLYAGFNNSERYTVFNVDLSSANLTGATVKAAVCSVWNYTSRSDSFRVIVRLSDTVNAVIPTSRDIAEAQAKTTAYAVFEKQDETTWSAGSLHTFDITEPLQELADSYGDDLGSVNIYWESVNPQGHQQFRSFDNGNSPKSLTLNLIYETP